MYAVIIAVGSREIALTMPSMNDAVNLRTQLELSDLSGNGTMLVQIHPMA